jgi:hypothetical protein
LLSLTIPENILLKYKFFVSFLLSLPTLVNALDAGGVDMDVRADIHSSIQMHWSKLNADDNRYQDAKNKLNLDHSFILLPYGLYAELQTNDKNRVVSLRLENLVSVNKIDKISNESVYISHNGNKPVSAKYDLVIQDPQDRGLLKKHILLFIIKTHPSQRPGQYIANFKFINNNLP